MDYLATFPCTLCGEYGFIFFSLDYLSETKIILVRGIINFFSGKLVKGSGKRLNKIETVLCTEHTWKCSQRIHVLSLSESGYLVK
jgi:hypothetical protein